MVAASPPLSELRSRLIKAARGWPGMSVQPRPEGALALQLRGRAIGLLPPSGPLLVPLPDPIRTVLLDQGLAAEPEAGPEAASGGGGGPEAQPQQAQPQQAQPQQAQPRQVQPQQAQPQVAHPVASENDVAPATLLLRLSYLYRRLLRARDADTLRRISVELGRRDVPTALRAIYDAMLEKRGLGAGSPGLPSRP